MSTDTAMKPDIAALKKRLAEDQGFWAEVTGDRPPPPGCHTPEGCRENGCLGWCDAHKPPTRGQKMREAGYTRRPSKNSFPSDE